MKPDPFFITTAIDYTNGAPHIGHAYEKVLADVLARHQRQRGREVFFLTGVDQHGQKVQQSAAKLGVDPAEFVAANTGKFLALWKTLGISHDRWAATTDPVHTACVREILSRVHSDGFIYKARQAGFYSVRQEQFVTDKERGADGSFGPEWGEVVELEEENYYFRLMDHREWLLGFIDSHGDFIAPEFRRAELRNAVEKLAGDLCISRPKSRLSWGIELPFDSDYVTYVWFDALVNYLSFAPGFDPAPGADLTTFRRFWSGIVHVIGKDILVPPHGVYWPVMLHALGFADDQIPRLLVHGWWNIAGAKMSKSVGNIVDPVDLCERYGTDAVRYFLVRDIAVGQDADFAESRLVSRANAELANGLGNLLNRTLNMAKRYRSGRLVPVKDPDEATIVLRSMFPSCVETFCRRMDAFAVHSALDTVVGLVSAANAYVDTTAPWKLAKQPEQGVQLDNVLGTLAAAIRIAATLLQSVIPGKAAVILDQLRIAPVSLDGVPADAGFADFPDGHVLGDPLPVFPRIETTPDDAGT